MNQRLPRLGRSRVWGEGQTPVHLSTQVRDLVNRAQSGDSSAFGILYEDTVDRVYAICLRMSGNAVEAEDLTQEVYIRCWEKLSLYRGESQFKTWLHRLTVNHVLNATYRMDRIASLEFTVEKIDSLRDPGHPGISDLRLDLERALSLLSTKARQTLMRKYVHGYMYEEMAKTAGVAVGTLRSRVHRARKTVLALLC